MKKMSHLLILMVMGTKFNVQLKELDFNCEMLNIFTKLIST